MFLIFGSGIIMAMAGVLGKSMLGQILFNAIMAVVMTIVFIFWDICLVVYYYDLLYRDS